MKKKSIKIIFCIIIILIIIFSSNEVHAVLQANKPDGQNNKSLVNKSGTEFITAIRQMETKDGTLGVNSSIDTTGESYIDSSKNGMDCHMALSTEWGTAAILSSSSYGSIPKGDDHKNDSTTGNNSGIFQMGDDIVEYVAGYNKKSNLSLISKLDSRYYNEYQDNSNGDSVGYLTGDGLDDMKGWNSGTYTLVGNKFHIWWRFQWLSRDLKNIFSYGIVNYNDYGDYKRGGSFGCNIACSFSFC